MSTLTLKIVLLFAVVSSQLFGGISCCCLGRFLSETAGTASDVSTHSSSGGAPQGEDSQPVKRCPKCSRGSTNRGEIGSHSRKQPSAKICDGEQCRCAKLAVNATPPKDPLTKVIDHPLWVPPTESLVTGRDSTLVDLRKYEVPIRFGGRSWQSIACVWKN